MLLMLGSPTLLYLIAHIIFPDEIDATLEDYYFRRARQIWSLAGMTVIIGTLFRPLAFGLPLWVLDNASAIPLLVICIVLAVTRAPWVHRILVPLVLITVLLDTLVISFSLQ